MFVAPFLTMETFCETNLGQDQGGNQDLGLFRSTRVVFEIHYPSLSTRDHNDNPHLLLKLLTCVSPHVFKAYLGILSYGLSTVSLHYEKNVHGKVQFKDGIHVHNLIPGILSFSAILVLPHGLHGDPSAQHNDVSNMRVIEKCYVSHTLLMYG